MTTEPKNPNWQGNADTAAKPLSADLMRGMIQAVHDSSRRVSITDRHGAHLIDEPLKPAPVFTQEDVNLLERLWKSCGSPVDFADSDAGALASRIKALIP